MYRAERRLCWEIKSIVLEKFVSIISKQATYWTALVRSISQFLESNDMQIAQFRFDSQKAGQSVYGVRLCLGAMLMLYTRAVGSSTFAWVYTLIFFISIGSSYFNLSENSSNAKHMAEWSNWFSPRSQYLASRLYLETRIMYHAFPEI